MSKKLFLLLGAVFICCCCIAQNRTSRVPLESFKNDESLRNASWSVKAVKVKDGSVILSHNSSMSLIPASLEKLVTTGVGYQLLGKDFRFKTVLMYDGEIGNDSILNGNIYIIGGGDPLLGSYRYKQTTPDAVFSNWEASLRKAGIKGVNGSLCYDAGIFDTILIHDSWIWEDIGNYYGCGASGLSFHENMYHVYFLPDTINTIADIVYIDPPLKGLTLRNSVKTGKKGSGDNVVIYGIPYDNVRYLTGTVPLGEKNFAVRGSMPNPPLACASLFYDYLMQEGFIIKKEKIANITGNPDYSQKLRKTIIEYNSHSYQEIVALTNSQSNNMYAECIFKYLGSSYTQQGSFSTGRKTIIEYLKDKRIGMAGVNIVDGSGLSRENLLTSDFLCDFLRFMRNSSLGADFANSLLPVNRSVILNKTLDSKKQESFRFKTGTMKQVRSYAGYIANSQGELICFSIIVNNFNCTQAEIRAKIEKLIAQIAESQ